MLVFRLLCVFLAFAAAAQATPCQKNPSILIGCSWLIDCGDFYSVNLYPFNYFFQGASTDQRPTINPFAGNICRQRAVRRLTILSLHQLDPWGCDCWV
jgi:hypothetical protein